MTSAGAPGGAPAATTDARLALLIANAEYDDAGLAGLVSPAQDASGLAHVLADPATCGFTVSTVVDGRSDEVGRAVEDFLAERDRGDLLLLYFSCHGLKDEYGRLYFAARNTVRNRLRSTAIPAGVVNDLLLGCRSRRKVLVLDCCYSGAFAKGMHVKADPSIHTGEQFDARGLVVLTASDATQYAFEGDAVHGDAAPSVFTASLVEGLETGSADIDRDGLISVDDAYEYVRRTMGQQRRPQSPRKWEFDVQGRIVIARSAVAGTAVDPATGPTVSILPPATVPAAHPTGTPTISVLRQPRWWAGVALLLATVAPLTWLVAALLAGWLYGSAPEEYLPSAWSYSAAVVLATGAWVLAYAAADAYRHGADLNPTPPRWYDLTLAWLRHLAAVRQPAGWRARLGSAVTAVPLNIVGALVISLAATAATYTLLGSSARDRVFAPLFAALTALMLVAFVRRHPRGVGRASPAKCV